MHYCELMNGQINSPKTVKKKNPSHSRNSLINELCGDSKGPGHIVECETSVRLKELGIGQYPHLPGVEAVMGSQVPVVLQDLLDFGWKRKNIIDFYKNYMTQLCKLHDDDDSPKYLKNSWYWQL